MCLLYLWMKWRLYISKYQNCELISFKSNKISLTRCCLSFLVHYWFTTTITSFTFQYFTIYIVSIKVWPKQQVFPTVSSPEKGVDQIQRTLHTEWVVFCTVSHRFTNTEKDGCVTAVSSQRPRFAFVNWRTGVLQSTFRNLQERSGPGSAQAALSQGNPAPFSVF